jgi:hypothetical protein
MGLVCYGTPSPSIFHRSSPPIIFNKDYSITAAVPWNGSMVLFEVPSDPGAIWGI